MHTSIGPPDLPNTSGILRINMNIIAVIRKGAGAPLAFKDLGIDIKSQW